MIAGVANTLRLLDAFYCLGLGMLLGVFYTLLRALFGGRRAGQFLCDGAVFAAGYLLLFSYNATYAYTGVVRWYMALPLVVGCVLFTAVFGVRVQRVADRLRALLRVPFKLLRVRVLAPLLLRAKHYFAATVKKRQKKPRKNAKSLSKPAKMLYNSN